MSDPNGFGGLTCDANVSESTRNPDKSSNRHCSGNKVCRVCHEAWGSVGVSGNRRTPGGRSVEQVLTLLIVEELALIGMFRRMAQ